MAEHARDLDRRFVGFSAGIGKEHTIEAGELAQPVREQLLLFDAVQVRLGAQVDRLVVDGLVHLLHVVVVGDGVGGVGGAVGGETDGHRG